MKEVIRYQCNYCEKIFRAAGNAHAHEWHKCWHNPDHHTCFTCGLFVDAEDLGVLGRYFSDRPHCQVDHDLVYHDTYEDFKLLEPRRQFKCAMWEPREDWPGEYVKFKTGSGGFRKIYMSDFQELKK